MSKCRVCGVEYYFLKWRRFRPETPRGYVVVKSSFCGPECQCRFYREDQSRKDKIGAAFTGAKHWAWKGGISQINNMGRRGHGWESLAEKVRERDGRKCQSCGMTETENGRRLDVHHIKPFHDFSKTSEANKPKNLEALCKGCHKRKEHRNGGVKQMILPLGESMGRGRPCRGELVNTNKLKAEEVCEIRRGADMGIPLIDMARKLSVSNSTISAIVKGKTWRHLPMSETQTVHRTKPPVIRGEASCKSVITEQQALQVISRMGGSGAAIARELGISKSIVYAILSRKTWKHLSP